MGVTAEARELCHKKPVSIVGWLLAGDLVNKKGMGNGASIHGASAGR